MRVAVNCQTQIGQDIQGYQSEEFGYAVSMPSTNTIAVGAPGAGSVGRVRVYSRSNDTWVQKGRDISPPRYSMKAGSSVSMPDENTVAIGSPLSIETIINDFVVNPRCGNVSVFQCVDNVWVQKGSTIVGDSEGDMLGSSVSMPDANTVAVMASQRTTNLKGPSYVKVYKWEDSMWVQKGSTLYGSMNYDMMATNPNTMISMPDSNTIAFTADLNHGNVGVFSWDGIDWVQKGRPVGGGSNMGWSISMPDANTIAVVSPTSIFGEKYSGTIRVFYWNGETWAAKGKNIAEELQANSQFTIRYVSMTDSNTLAVGSENYVAIFQWNGSRWRKIRKTIFDTTRIKDSFKTVHQGPCVSMPTPNTVGYGIVYSGSESFYSGEVQIFSLDCSNTSNSISATFCKEYTSPSKRNTWTTSGVYLDTILNAAGCDSIITINLHINPVDTSVSRVHYTLTSNAGVAGFQWLDCNNNQPILGENSRTFIPKSNGNYAVAVSQNGCKDTSACYPVEVTSVEEDNGSIEVQVFPNPGNGQFILDLGKLYETSSIIVRDILGQEVVKTNNVSAQFIPLSIQNTLGIYFIEVKLKNNSTILKVIKE